VLAIGALLALLILAGCGHGAAAGSASSSSTGKGEAAVRFSQYMRAHGINIPDPQTSGGGIKIQNPGVNPDDPKFQQAQQACAKNLGVPGSMQGFARTGG